MEVEERQAPEASSLGPENQLEEEGQRFLERVEEASRGDDQIGGYTRTLEDQYGNTTAFDDPEPDSPTDLPSADDILRDVEDLLRGNGDS